MFGDLSRWFGEHGRTVKFIAFAGLGILGIIILLDWLHTRGQAAQAAATPDPNAAAMQSGLSSLNVTINDNLYSPPSSAPGAQPPAPQPQTFPRMPASGLPDGVPIGTPVGYEGGAIPPPFIHPVGLNPMPAVPLPDFGYFESSYYPTRD